MSSIILLFSACQSKKEGGQALTSGILLENLDTTVSPADDFYQYACGGWMKNHPLKGEYARYGSFDALAEMNQDQLKSLISGLAEETHEAGTVPQKIGDFYRLGMDSAAIEAQGAAPIQAELQSIAALEKEGLTKKLAEMELNGSGSPFLGIFGEADPKNSTMTIAWIWQSGLGIGDRDYYLEESSAAVRAEYVRLMAGMFQRAGYSTMAGFGGKENEMASNVLKLETEMAHIFMDKIALRDPHATYNIKTIDEFQKMLPAIDIKSYLELLGLGSLQTVNIGQVNYIEKLGGVLAKTDFNTIKAYLAWNVINAAAPYLSNEFVTADFDFYGKVLSGKTENKPRWKRVVSTVDGALGEAVGEMYVEKYFPAEAKERMLNLVKNLQSALGDRIQSNTWMTDETKAKAQEKLSAFIVKIGYPDQWRDYSGLDIKNDSYYANIVRARIFETRYQLAKIGKPVDLKEWYMTPQTVNAYYNPSTNEICFPAGILQPPFFDMAADDAFNYGAIGVVIGHEMTHGFDDQGRNYDKTGNLNNWWNDTDSKNFNERAQVLVDYFNGIEVYPGVFANGEFTLGENIADNGGVNISYAALQKAIADGGIAENLDGFTAAQRFFIAYAGVWAGNIRDEEIQRRTKEDPHSLGKWRVNATLPHISAFVEAFGVKEGDKMWIAPEKRADIW